MGHNAILEFIVLIISISQCASHLNPGWKIRLTSEPIGMCSFPDKSFLFFGLFNVFFCCFFWGFLCVYDYVCVYRAYTCISWLLGPSCT